MQPSISFVAIAIILVHHAGFVAEAKTPIVRECGTKSAAIIIDNASACIKSLKTSKSCSKKCNRIKDAILKGDNPTKCHKATLCTPIWRPKDLGFATAGSALAPFYYYGVMETLISSKILNQKTAPVGGLSGGAVVSLAVCGGVAPTLMQNASALAISQCLTSWNKTTQSIPCQGELTTLVVSLTQIVFPLNSTKFQKKCAGRIRIAMTKLNASDATMSSLSPYVRTKFVGTELYDAVAATAMIPCMSTCKPYTLFKGIPVVDGGFSATFKELCPPNVKRCITTQEYYPGKYVKAGGGECLKNGNDPVASGGEYECTMSVPSGFKFAPRGNLLTSCPTGSKYFQPPGFSDLYPGMHKENPLPYTCSEWQNFSYFPQDDSFQTQFDAGKKDAFIWGQNEGLIP